MDARTLGRLFKASLDPAFLTQAAREAKAFQRIQDVLPPVFLMALCLGCCTGEARTIAGCRRQYEVLARVAVGASTFEDRLTGQTVVWLWHVLQHVARPQNRAQTRHWPPVLKLLADIVVTDGTRMALPAALADVYRGTAPDQAAIKLLGSLSLATGTLGPVRFGAAVHHDRKLLRLIPKAGVLYLNDLGFYDHDLFAETDDAQAFFVSRLTAGIRPRITATHVGVPRRCKAVGQPLDRTGNDYGRTVNVDCAFRIHDDPAATHHTLRVVKLEVPWCDRHDHWTGAFRSCWYVTNLPRDTWNPEMIALVYRLRWAIERSWRRAKSLARLDHLRSQKPCVIFAFMLVSLLVQTLANRLATLLEIDHGSGTISRDRVTLTMLAWWPRLMLALAAPGHLPTALLTAFLAVLRREGRHPNPGQPTRTHATFEALAIEARILQGMAA